jgi:NADH-quinone oxidoreductase subunit E
MTFSPQLEQRLSKLMVSYPPGRIRSALIPMLLFCQDEVGHLSEEVMLECAKRLGLSRLQVDEVIGYYSMLHKKQWGKYHVQVCTNVSCMLTGGEELYQHAEKSLGIGHREVTGDGLFSLEEVECIGACSWAPAIQINYDFHHNVTPDMLTKLLDGIRKSRQEVQ